MWGRGDVAEQKSPTLDPGPTLEAPATTRHRPSTSRRMVVSSLQAGLTSGLRSPLLRSSASLASANIALGVGGLLFWLLAARLYPTREVGVAITVVAALTFLVSISSAGWPQLATRDGAVPARALCILRRALVSCALVGLTIVLAVLALPGHAGVAFDDLEASKFAVAVTASITVIASATSSCFDAVLIARRSSHRVLCEVLLSSACRVGALVLLTGAGPLGLLLANMVGALTGLVVSGCFVTSAIGAISRRRPQPQPSPPSNDIAFSVKTGVPAVVAIAPVTLLPTVVLGSLGASDAAVFTVALSIAYSVRMIPTVISQSMLAEAGRGKDPRQLLVRSIALTLALTSAACVVVIVAAAPLAQLYGASFAPHLVTIVAPLAISGAVAGVNYLLDTTLLALGHAGRYAWVNLLGSVLVFGFATLGAQVSLVSVGVGYIAAELVYMAVGWVALRTSSGWAGDNVQSRVEPTHRGGHHA